METKLRATDITEKEMVLTLGDAVKTFCPVTSSDEVKYRKRPRSGDRRDSSKSLLSEDSQDGKDVNVLYPGFGAPTDPPELKK